LEPQVVTRGPEIAEWLYGHFADPNDPQKPLTLTRDQLEFLCKFYEVDETGGYRYSTGALMAPKGFGKSTPLGAGIALAEFAGPYAPRTPIVQIAAVSEGQAYGNVYLAILDMLKENSGKAARELGIVADMGRLRLKGNTLAVLEAITTSPTSHEGNRATFVVGDQAESWTKASKGHKMFQVVQRNLAKRSGGRLLLLSNAHEVGEDSIAERIELESRTNPGILWVGKQPSTAPMPDMPDAQLLELLRQVVGPYVNAEETLKNHIRAKGTPWEESLRFWFNVPAGGASSAVDPGAWMAARNPQLLAPGTRVALGFDGSTGAVGGDCTALVACTKDGYLFPLLILPPVAGVIDKATVKQAVAQAFVTYDVGMMYADPWGWETTVDEWADEYGEERVVAYKNTRGRMIPATSRFRTDLPDGRITHSGDPVLTEHALNGVLRSSGRDGGHMIAKAAPARKVDALVAAILAYEAASQMEAEAPKPKAPPRVINLNDIPDDDPSTPGIASSGWGDEGAPGWEPV
jgi:hypothetical protein